MTDEPGGLEHVIMALARGARATAYLLGVRERELEQQLADAHANGQDLDQLSQELAQVRETRQQLEADLNKQLG